MEIIWTMIIAYPLRDLISVVDIKYVMVKKKGEKNGTKTKVHHVYQTAGMPTRVIVITDDMAILQNKKGEKFPTRKENIIWCHLGASN